MIDEELLGPSREYLANIMAQIKASEALAAQDIERYGYGSREYAETRWREHYMSIEPLRREQEAVTKTITDYFALQPMPPAVVAKDR